MNHRLLRRLLLCAHLLFALLLNSYAPLLPIIQQEFGISIAQSGILPTVIAFTIMVINLAAGMLIHRIGQKHIFVMAIILAVTGSVVIAVSQSFLLFIVGYTFIGFATGGAFTGATTIYAGLPEDLQNFGLYHMFFGIGGMLGPVILELWTGRGLDFRQLFLIYLVLFLMLFIWTMRMTISNVRYKHFTNKGRVLRSPIAFIGITLMSSYAVAEIGGTTWASNMIIDGYTFGSAPLVLSGFWLAFTLSRFVSDSLYRKIGPIRYIQIGMPASLLITILWMLGINPYLFVLLGFLFGPVFPMLQKYINNHLPDEQRGLFNGMTYATNSLFTIMVLPIMGLLGNTNMALAYIPILIFIVIVLILSGLLKAHMHR